MEDGAKATEGKLGGLRYYHSWYGGARGLPHWCPPGRADRGEAKQVTALISSGGPRSVESTRNYAANPSAWRWHEVKSGIPPGNFTGLSMTQTLAPLLRIKLAPSRLLSAGP